MQQLRLTPSLLQFMGLTIQAYRVGVAAAESLKDPTVDPKSVDADIDLAIMIMDAKHDLSLTQRDYLLGMARKHAGLTH